MWKPKSLIHDRCAATKYLQASEFGSGPLTRKQSSLTLFVSGHAQQGLIPVGFFSETNLLTEGADEDTDAAMRGGEGDDSCTDEDDEPPPNQSERPISSDGCALCASIMLKYLAILMAAFTEDET